MNVILTHKETGYQETGELKWKTKDCYVVHKPDGRDALYSMYEWVCDEVKENGSTPG